MIALAQFVDQTLFARPVRIEGRRGRRRILSHFLHLLPQTEGSHISPNFLDISETFGLGSDLPNIIPSERVVFVLGPDRVLFFVIDYNLVNGRIFPIRIVPTHARNLLIAHIGRSLASAQAAAGINSN
jgi:hypothetical protein